MLKGKFKNKNKKTLKCAEKYQAEYQLSVHSYITKSWHYLEKSSIIIALKESNTYDKAASTSISPIRLLLAQDHNAHVSFNTPDPN